MFKITSKGDFHKTFEFLKKNEKLKIRKILNKYGPRAVAALSAATPEDTGKTADSWKYEINETKNGLRLDFKNTNLSDGIPVAILIQYGHATRSGGYVQGTDYINPAIKPIMEEMEEEIWSEVTKK